ncbi:MAG: hypothetical protein JST87_10135 [Bacteroidetes bacterium]|nr:hypothetical protein [Bacteroidota bacterium]
MEGYIVPECYFDTVLVKSVLYDKAIVNHKKGCNNVAKAMRDGKLKDQFAVGIIDKDKNELDYLNEFVEYNYEKMNLFKHNTKPHFIIQLCPALERWILSVCEEANINIEDYGLPNNMERLKKITKSELADETLELRNLCNALVSSESSTISRFARWISYLKENKYQTDINELKNA